MVRYVICCLLSISTSFREDWPISCLDGRENVPLDHKGHIDLHLHIFVCWIKLSFRILSFPISSTLTHPAITHESPPHFQYLSVRPKAFVAGWYRALSTCLIEWSWHLEGASLIIYSQFDACKN